MLFLITV